MEKMSLDKEDLEFLDRIGVDGRRMKTIMKNKEHAERYQNLVLLFEQYDGGLHRYIDDLFCGRLPESKAYENLKKQIAKQILRYTERMGMFGINSKEWHTLDCLITELKELQKIMEIK